MTWSAPPTAVFQQAPPYTWWNTYVRDNLNETAVAKATTAGYHFVSTGTNSIAERGILQAVNNTSDTTSSTSYTANLASTTGPSLTITTGAFALVWINSAIANSGANTSAVSFGISGATTSAPDNNWDIQQDGGAGTLNRYSSCTLVALTPGSNVFTMQYLVSSGASTGTFSRRRIQVMGL